jgi:hypothetical protein
VVVLSIDMNGTANDELVPHLCAANCAVQTTLSRVYPKLWLSEIATPNSSMREAAEPS